MSSSLRRQAGIRYGIGYRYAPGYTRRNSLQALRADRQKRQSGNGRHNDLLREAGFITPRHSNRSRTLFPKVVIWTAGWTTAPVLANSSCAAIYAGHEPKLACLSVASSCTLAPLPTLKPGRKLTPDNHTQGFSSCLFQLRALASVLNLETSCQDGITQLICPIPLLLRPGRLSFFSHRLNLSGNVH